MQTAEPRPPDTFVTPQHKAASVGLVSYHDLESFQWPASREAADEHLRNTAGQEFLRLLSRRSLVTLEEAELWDFQDIVTCSVSSLERFIMGEGMFLAVLRCTFLRGVFYR